MQPAEAAHSLSELTPPNARVFGPSNPFPGLRAYGGEEAHLFFGREQHVETLLRGLALQRLSAVVGLSGSGKSSLVLAGVLPRLRRGYRVKTVQSPYALWRSSWRIAQLRPGDDPLMNLAIALRCAAQPEPDGPPVLAAECTADQSLELDLLKAQLQRSQRGLVEACETYPLDPDESLLIVVDQFEELFRFRELSRSRRSVDDPATAFVQLLLRACQQDRIPIYVMLTLRSEFIGECAQFAGFAEAVNQGQFLLPLLNRDQREQVIRGPMSVASAAIAPALVQRLLNDAGDMTDQLPLLQHALMRSFDRWQSAPNPTPELRIEHYDASGGMKRALSQHADEALAELGSTLGAEGRRVAERLFRCLTERGPRGQGVRRPCRVDEVLAVADTDLATLSQVVACFASKRRGFLLTSPAGEALSAGSLLDISHEALIRRWRQLGDWTSAERAFASQLGYLHDAAQKYERGLVRLWGDPELSLAVEWMQSERPSQAAATRYGVDLAAIHAFLQKSEEARAEALAVALDAQLLRRFRRLFTDTRRSTLISLLTVFVVLVCQGAGLFESLWPWSTRLKLLSVPARYLGVARGLDQALRAVVIDEETRLKLRDQTRLGERLGDLGATWRTLQADVLTRLTDAGAKVVAFDIQFGNFRDAQDRPRNPSPLEQEGTEAFAAAIQRARRRGTAVVVAAGAKSADGTLDTHPLVAEALAAQGTASSAYAVGAIASACISFAEYGPAVFVPLLTTHAQRPHQPGIALAALAGLWNLPNLVLDRSARMLFLAGGGRQGSVAFAGLGRTIERGEQCVTFVPGDVPAQQIVDLSPSPLTRGNQAVIPFEDVLQGKADAAVAGKIILVGAQLRESNGALRDGHRVLQCGAAPWSCAWTSRWGMELHLDALSNLLERRAVRPIGPIEQLGVILALCLAVAWFRLRNRDERAWRRWGALAALVVVDLGLVAAAAIVGDILMDEAYHVVAMVGTHLIVGRLDRH